MLRWPLADGGGLRQRFSVTKEAGAPEAPNPLLGRPDHRGCQLCPEVSLPPPLLSPYSALMCGNTQDWFLNPLGLLPQSQRQEIQGTV